MVRDYARGIIELEFSRDLGALLPITAEEGNRVVSSIIKSTKTIRDKKERERERVCVWRGSLLGINLIRMKRAPLAVSLAS